MTQAVKTYKGFEIYPLVYPHRSGNSQTSRNPDAGYEASVRICRVGADAAAQGRVFRLPRMWPFEGAGEARLACTAHAEQLIDGQVDGRSVADL